MKNTKILVVQDDPSLGKVLSEFLTAKNFNVELARDCDLGLDKFMRLNVYWSSEMKLENCQFSEVKLFLSKA